MLACVPRPSSVALLSVSDPHFVGSCALALLRGPSHSCRPFSPPLLVGPTWVLHPFWSSCGAPPLLVVSVAQLLLPFVPPFVLPDWFLFACCCFAHARRRGSCGSLCALWLAHGNLTRWCSRSYLMSGLLRRPLSASAACRTLASSLASLPCPTLCPFWPSHVSCAQSPRRRYRSLPDRYSPLPVHRRRCAVWCLPYGGVLPLCALAVLLACLEVCLPGLASR